MILFGGPVMQRVRTPRRRFSGLRPSGVGAACVGATMVACVVATLATGVRAAPPSELADCQTVDPVTGAPIIDAACFFDALIERYRRLKVYSDVADVLQITHRLGEKPRRVETRIGCGVANGELKVETGSKQITRWLGGGLGLGGFAGRSQSPAMREAALRYKIWLAPHMALKFADKPKEEFRSGVPEGFTATEAEEVQIGDKSMVHLEIQSGDGQDEDPEATFDLYVNPDSMLVERIIGSQRLPGGGEFRTTLDITPTTVETAPVEEEAPDVNAPAVNTPPGAPRAPETPEPPVTAPPLSGRKPPVTVGGLGPA